MKCLIINGSPAKNYSWNGAMMQSFTSKLVDEVKETMSRLGEMEYDEIWLSEVNLPYCKGCYNCFLKGEDKCPHAGLVQPIINKMKEADCVILTSPVFALHVSALVKGFFDLAAYNYHRPSFFDKRALVVSSTAGGMAKRNCKYMRDTLKHWGYNAVYTLPVIRMGASELNEKMKRKCHSVATALYDSMKSGRLKSPSFKRVFFYQLWKVLSLGGADGSRDRIYWETSGLGGHQYAPIVKVGVVKDVFGKIMSGILRKVMPQSEKK